MGSKKPDFSGWATKNDIRCKDGRTIRSGAFKHMDKVKVPLVWQHQHGDPMSVLGHAMLENRAFGVYTYGYFNDSDQGRQMKRAVENGDIESMSIFANNLRETPQKDVLHGDIKEVSLVIAGANPGALIENVSFAHGDSNEISYSEDEVIIHTGLALEHEEPNEGENNVATKADNKQTTETEGRTVKEIFDGLSEEEKNVVYIMIGQAVEDADNDNDSDDSAEHGEIMDGEEFLAHINNTIQEGFDDMARNSFENNGGGSIGATLSHAEVKSIMEEAAQVGKLSKVIKAHVESSEVLAHAGEYGITDIDFMFPDAKVVGATPELIARQADWVPKVLGATKHAPFAKIKTLLADITASEARAKGYIKGTEKVDEVLSLLKRTTSPTTVYKKQKLDRDDILDITDFEVVAWLKWEIRFMLNEELARAILLGDGRSVGSPDKIKDPVGATDGNGIRSILNDSDLYAVKVDLAANVTNDVIVDEITRSRTDYRGSGTPTLYTTDKVLTDMLLLKDKMGRRLYDTVDALASVLRVKEIVPVEVMGEYPNVLGIVVNLTDYTVGSNKGGEISFFDDFDIDFNQEKYLMETRVSGALTKPKSALVIRRATGTLATATAPSFDGATNTITIPTSTGVIYTINDAAVSGDVVIDTDTTVVAVADAGYYLAAGSTNSWTFGYTAA